MIYLKSYNEHITFELNEKLRCKKEHEIDEMISISLDPDIVIQTYDDYIQIRGVVFLVGEYHLSPLVHRDEVHREQVEGQFIENVEHIDENIVQFSHRFPVEISVQKERIKQIDDIVVKVDSFDYELPSAQIIKIVASLDIHGITLNKHANLSDKVIESTDGKSSTETKNDSLIEKINKNTDTEPFVSDNGEKEQTKEEAEQTSNQIDDTSEEHTSTIESNDSKSSANLRLVKNETTMPVESDEEENSEPLQQINDTEESKLEGEVHEKEESKEPLHTLKQETNEMQIEVTEAKESDDSDVKDVTFLTELFEESEESHSCVTIYIAQQDDSIESIAKRYEIPVLQLLKDNHLSADKIEEGQLLTIRKRNTSTW